MCNVRSLYWVGSLMRVSKELSKHKLHLVGVQKVKQESDGIISAGTYTFSTERGM
jgi:hypothetical protein